MKKETAVRFPIRKKIILLCAAVTLPFVFLVVYMLVSVADYSRTYGEIVDHMTIANNYNLGFTSNSISYLLTSFYCHFIIPPKYYIYMERGFYLEQLNH